MGGQLWGSVSIVVSLTVLGMTPMIHYVTTVNATGGRMMNTRRLHQLTLTKTAEMWVN